MADSFTLAYKAAPGASVAVQGGFTTTLDVSGPPILTRQLTGSNPLLSLQTYRVTGDGRRTVEASDRGCAVRIQYDQAHVEGIFGSKPFDFNVFPTVPDNLTQDKLVEITWGLAMAGRHYLLSPLGAYRPAKADIDAHGEAFAVLIDGPVRLPEAPVTMGQEWTTTWDGECTHKETGAFFRYVQQAILFEFTDGRAHIPFKTTGALHFPNKPSAQREESVIETKGTIVLDVQGGAFVSVECAGTITTELKQAGVKLVRGTSAKYELT